MKDIKPQLMLHKTEIINKEETKAEKFKGTWEKLFMISPEENMQFDKLNEGRVDVFINENRVIITSYTTSDLSRLSNDD